MGEHHAGRLLGHGLEVPGDEAAVSGAAHELLALVMPAEAGELLGALVHLLLLLCAQVPQGYEAAAESNQKFGRIRGIFWGFKARHQTSISSDICLFTRDVKHVTWMMGDGDADCLVPVDDVG